MSECNHWVPAFHRQAILEGQYNMHCMLTDTAIASELAQLGTSLANIAEDSQQEDAEILKESLLAQWADAECKQKFVQGYRVQEFCLDLVPADGDCAIWSLLRLFEGCPGSVADAPDIQAVRDVSWPWDAMGAWNWGTLPWHDAPSCIHFIGVQHSIQYAATIQACYAHHFVGPKAQVLNYTTAQELTECWLQAAGWEVWQALFFAMGLQNEVRHMLASGDKQIKQDDGPHAQTPKSRRRKQSTPPLDQMTPNGKKTNKKGRTTAAVGSCRPANFGQPEIPEAVFAQAVPKKRKTPCLQGEEEPAEEDQDASEEDLGCFFLGVPAVLESFQ